MAVVGQGVVVGGWTGADAAAGGGRARSRPARYVFSHTNSSRRSPSKSRNMVSIGHWTPPQHVSKNAAGQNMNHVAAVSLHLGQSGATGQEGRELVRCVFFFARCCLGKIPGGASFSQLHKGDKQSRADTPKLAKYKQIQATNSRQQQNWNRNKKGGNWEMKPQKACCRARPYTTSRTSR